MKKIKYLSLFIIAFILAIPSVSAAVYGVNGRELKAQDYSGTSVKDSTKTQNLYRKYDYNDYGVKINENQSAGKYYIHRYSVNNSTNSIFCLDPNFSGDADIYAKRFLILGSTGSVYAYDIASMTILKNYYDAYSNGSSVVDPEANAWGYMAASIAVRAVEAVWEFNNGPSPAEFTKWGESVKRLYSAYWGQAYNWIAYDNEIKEAYDKLVANGVVDSGRLGELSAYSGYKFTEASENIVATAKAMFKNALKAAADASNATTSKITSTSTPETVKSTNDGNGVLLSQDIKHTITLENFNLSSPEASFQFSNVTFKQDVSLLGAVGQPEILKIEVKAGGQTFEGRSGENLLQALKTAGITDNKIIIEITIRVSGYQSSSTKAVLNCSMQPMEYTINYTYNDGVGGSLSNLDGFVGIVWYGQTATSDNHRQRFISIEPNGSGDSDGANPSGTSGTINGQAQLMDSCGCAELEQACIASGNRYSQACRDFENANCGCDYLDTLCHTFGDDSACNTYNATCNVNCDTTVSADWVCCDDEDDILYIEGINQDYKEIEINGPDAYACFVSKVNGAKDSETGYAGMNVEDQNHNSYTLQTNKYCAVNCKEDYFMSLPTSQRVSAGRYFTFKARIDGTKTCYTNTIDRIQFNKDIANAQKEMINAYNDYLLYTAVQAKIDSGSHKTSRNCISVCGGTYTNYSLNVTVTGYSYTENSNGTLTISNNKSLSYNKSSLGSSGRSYCCVSCEEGGCCGSCCSSGSCKSGIETEVTTFTENGVTKTPAQKIEEAKTAMTRAQENYRHIISQFNDCTNWDADIKYDPEVTYDYDEDYIRMLPRGIGEMYGTKVDDDKDSWYCNGELRGGNYDGCSNSNTSEQKTTMSYVYCDLTGCSTSKTESSQVINNANYKKITSSVGYSYRPKTLFYNIYPNGQISKDEVNNSTELESKLPVSLSKPKGIYKYTLKIDNLGEFYRDPSSDNLGRYAGSSTAIVDPDGIEYNCTYLVNLGIKCGEELTCDFDDGCTDDCVSNCIGPNCDGGCEGDFCSSNCIGVGCVYDDKKGSYIQQKSVSLSNLFPNGTTSHNWNKNNRDSIAKEKAQETVENIESAGNSVYDKEPILSITLNPSTSAAIRKYNDAAKNEGSYSNYTLTCRSLDGYRNIACYSEFISDLIDGRVRHGGSTYLANANIVNDKSKALDLRSVTDNDRDYFISWRGTISERSMIGPSWRLGGNN